MASRALCCLLPTVRNAHGLCAAAEETMHRVHSPPSSVQRGLGGAAAFLQAASKAQTCQQWLLWTKVGGGGEPGQLPAEGRTRA